MVTTQRAPGPRPTRDRPGRRFPWHALAVTVAAAWLVLAVAVPLVAVLAVLAGRRTAAGLPVLRDAAFLATVVALCTLAEPGVRVLVLGIAVVGLFLWGSPDDD